MLLSCYILLEGMTALIRKTSVKRLFAAIGCLLILASLVVPVSAAEGTISCTYVPITGDGFVADTMNGVEARYNLYGPTLYCVELVVRYYAEVYGLEIRCSDGGPAVLNNDDLYFEETTNPQPGDVMFGSAAARGKGYNHWALVKSNNGSSLTLFEQNWRWNGQAGINREIEYPTTYYKIYTLKSRSGADIEPVSGSVAVASTWAESYIDRAAEAGIATLETDYQSEVTREAFCQMAVNVLANYGVEPMEDGTACEEAAELGLVSSLDGQEVLTRQEAAVITYRLAQRIGGVSGADLNALETYDDAAAIAAWAQEAVAQLTACGLMSGSNGKFDPNGTMTNEQAVALMVRVDENPNPAVTYRSSKPDATDSAVTSVLALDAGESMLFRILRGWTW